MSYICGNIEGIQYYIYKKGTDREYRNYGDDEFTQKTGETPIGISPGT
jgi:hypothetical protein